MKKYPISIYNYSPGLIGKITRKPVNFIERKNYILISENSDIPSGYKAIIFKDDNSKFNSSSKIIIIPHFSECLSQIDDGDILLSLIHI